MNRPIKHPALNGLRGVAMLLVIGFTLHLCMVQPYYEFRTDKNTREAFTSSYYKSGNQWFQNGRYGIDIFFILSGFLITYQLAIVLRNNNKKDFMKKYYVFLSRRVFRIFPLLFFVFILVVFAFPLSKPFHYTGEPEDEKASEEMILPTFWRRMLSKVLLLTFNHQPSVFTEKEDGSDTVWIMPWTWTLAIEWMFYVFIFPLVWYFQRFKGETNILPFVLLGMWILDTLLYAYSVAMKNQILSNMENSLGSDSKWVNFNPLDMEEYLPLIESALSPIRHLPKLVLGAIVGSIAADGLPYIKTTTPLALGSERKPSGLITFVCFIFIVWTISVPEQDDALPFIQVMIPHSVFSFMKEVIIFPGAICGLIYQLVTIRSGNTGTVGVLAYSVHLTLSVFAPLAHLSYASSLIHPVLAWYLYDWDWLHDSPYYTFKDLAFRYCILVAITCVVCEVLYRFVEVYAISHRIPFITPPPKKFTPPAAAVAEKVEQEE